MRLKQYIQNNDDFTVQQTLIKLFDDCMPFIRDISNY